MGDVIRDVQDPEPSAIGHLVMHKVQSPPGIGPCFDKNGSPGTNGPSPGLASAHTQALFPVKPVDAGDTRRLMF